ncbi:MAG TPA: hypothetical protein VE596_18340 [Gaiellaceae bacterium]|nr:hypothetical protein [Gaiellaceae bacterium]
MKLLSSPRRRRRLTYVGMVVLAGGVVALVVELVPNKHGTVQHFTSGRIARIAPEHQVPLSGRDRRAINAVLDRFVGGVVTRRDPLAGWAVATPRLRDDSTRAEWARGDVPVYAYPARGTQFHAWVLEYSFRNSVGLELGVQPRSGAKIGNAAFEVDLKRIDGRWLVDSIYVRTIYPR